jgi:hypothetical protein
MVMVMVMVKVKVKANPMDPNITMMNTPISIQIYNHTLQMPTPTTAAEKRIWH